MHTQYIHLEIGPYIPYPIGSLNFTPHPTLSKFSLNLLRLTRGVFISSMNLNPMTAGQSMRLNGPVEENRYNSKK